MSPAPHSSRVARKFAAILLPIACIASGGATAGPPQQSSSPGSADIKLNQLGFLPGADKIAVVPGAGDAHFVIVKADSDTAGPGSASRQAGIPGFT